MRTKFYRILAGFGAAGTALALALGAKAESIDASTTAAINTNFGDLATNVLGLLTGTALGKIFLVAATLVGIYLLWKLFRRFTGR